MKTSKKKPRKFNMQCGVETMNDCERSPGRQGLRVNFTEKGEVKERREKFLTAKYGSHQMSLIRKRLAVEMWLYDELQKLYDPPVSIFGIFFEFTYILMYFSEYKQLRVRTNTFIFILISVSIAQN